MKKRLIIMILSVVLVLSSILTIFAYSNIKYNNNKLIYSNMIDKKTQNSVKEILKENKINEKDIDTFIKAVNNYNKLQVKILQNNINISKSGYSSINA
ncbi:hypothetical protein XC20_11345, partial [Clostridioides difficile]